MGTKGQQARTRIVECARGLFGQKGYCGVTMQDISEASGFSRGGLYRHFASTEEIFLEIIRQEQTEAFASLERALSEQVRPDQILKGFLQSRMRALSQPSRSFDVAISEFAANSEKGRDALARRAEDSVRILTQLIQSGNETGVFSCPAPESTATHIMWLIEGLSRHAGLIPVTELQIEEQIDQVQRLLKP